MRRASVIGLILVGLVLFFVLSALLARALSVGGAEQSAITDVVRAEAHGDPGAVVASIQGCQASQSCRTRARADAQALRRSGGVQIIQVQPSAGFSVGSTLGTARVAWLVGGSLPRVQCVRVRRAGDVLSGFHVQLLELSPRIRSNADCPAHF
ncbi:MAG: hypothetical protein M3016_01705 [Actinomycetota bacterium]|nr:hypothetical protein [Actinomycetota bacterium]